MNNNELNNFQKPLQTQDEESIDIKSIVIKFLSYWYLFIIFGFFSLVAGYLYNRYSPNVYQVSSTVFVKETKMGLDATSMMTGMNFRSMGNVQNEIGILQSYMLAERAVKNLDFNVSYYAKGRLATMDMYKDSPFTVELDYSQPQLVGMVYNLKMLEDGKYRLTAEAKGGSKYDFVNEQYVGGVGEINIDEVYSFGDTVNNGYNAFRIILNSHYQPNNKMKLMFRVNSTMSLVGMLRGGLSVANISKEASLLRLTMQGTNPAKITDALNQICEEFIKRDLDLKNRVSENTIKFIDNELEGIQKSLSEAEVNLQNFQQGNDFMNLDKQASDLYNYLKEQEKRKAELELNLKYYTDLKTYVRANLNEPDKLIAPSAMGIGDPLLNSLVGSLVELSSRKQTQDFLQSNIFRKFLGEMLLR